MGYARELVVKQRVSEALVKAYGNKTIVVWRGPGLEEEQLLATVGTLRLLLMDRDKVPPPSSQRVAADPVLCARRGAGLWQNVLPEEDYVGVDDQVCTNEYLVDRLQTLASGVTLTAGSQPLSGAKFLTALHPGILGRPSEDEEHGSPLSTALSLIALPEARKLPLPATSRVKVAIVDASFTGMPSGLKLAAEFKGLSMPNTAFAPAPLEASHGTRMLCVIREALVEEKVEFKLLRTVESEGQTPNAWLTPSTLALSLAHAVGDWGADVVLIAMSNGMWGTPPHLRAVLREVQRIGRGGKGVPIICSVGDASSNHDKDDTSYVLAADELASQPWVMAVAATDAAGRWYRRFGKTRCQPLNRFGPAVALSAPGEFYQLAELGNKMVDDSSAASALVAATVAMLLRRNPKMRAVDLQAVLQRTADVPAVVDEGPGAAASRFIRWDGEGRNFKLGAGRINALAATLAAADPVCFALLRVRSRPGRIPTQGITRAEPLVRRSIDWLAWTTGRGLQELEGEPLALLKQYLELRGELSWLLIHSLPFREAILWGARHLAALWSLEEEDPDLEGVHDHGALLDRVAYVFEALRGELHLTSRATEIAAWIDGMERLLQARTGGALKRFLCGAGGALGEPLLGSGGILIPP
jgi:hypothetical protein